jgi:hypothetical protein
VGVEKRRSRDPFHPINQSQERNADRTTASTQRRRSRAGKERRNERERTANPTSGAESSVTDRH